MRHRLLKWFLGLMLCLSTAASCTAQEKPAETAPPPATSDGEVTPGLPDDPYGLGATPYDPAEQHKREAAFQALVGEFQNLMRKVGADEKTDWDDVAEARLRVEQCALLLGRYTPSTFRDRRFDHVRASARKMIGEMLAGKKPTLPKTGLIERAYFSQVDLSAQPYFVYVPETLPADRKPPLIIFLHGYVTELDKVNWYEMTVPTSVNDLADRIGAIVVTPFARSNTDFLGIGERDVLETMRRVIEDYGADPERVFLTGVSMGGSGVWAMGAHHPDLFAGAVPVAGRTDYNLWQNIDRGTLATFKQMLIDRDYAIVLQPNFRNLPVFAFHGEIDTLVRPAQTKVMVEKLKERGFDVRFHEIPNGDHWSFGEAFKSEALAAWMKDNKRTASPRHVSYVTWHPRFNRCYWVTIEDFVAFGKAAEIDVEVKDRKRVRVKAENVARFRVDLARAPIDADARFTTDDGNALEPKKVDGGLVFTLAPTPAGGLRKTPVLAGPLWEACQEPFILVFGTKGDAQKARYTQARTVTFAKEWMAFAAGVPRIRADEEVNEDDIRNCHLVLFGTPATNAVIKRIADKLPVTLGDHKFTIGGKTFEGDDLGLAMIYPNPLNPKKYVVIFSGMHWGMGLPKNHKLDLLADYIVFRKELGPVNGTNAFEVAGFFDINWKLDDKLMWFGPEKAPPRPDWANPDWNDPDWNDEEPAPQMPEEEKKPD